MVKRIYKFRAIDKETNKWCIGSVYPKDGEVRIDAFWTYYFGGLLKKETLGQFTGLKDKNDKEIYFDYSIITDGMCTTTVKWDSWSLLDDIQNGVGDWEIIRCAKSKNS